MKVAEDTIIRMQQLGIGQREMTSVSVLPAHVHYEMKMSADGTYQTNSPNPSMPTLGCLDGAAAESTLKRNAVKKFYSSVKSRLLVAEIATRIKSGAQFTFDYLLLALLAALIAFFGLTENSTVVLVASMLVSPIMGPILAGIFGSVIHDKKIRNLGVKVELFSLFLCVLIGFTMGLAYSPFVRHYQLDRYPTMEMVERGKVRNLIIGVLVAIPSGAGVALGVLGGNSGSLVGVAISASLLPPAVNCGALWALSLLCIDNCDHNNNKNDSLVMGWTFNKSMANAEDGMYFFEPNYQDATSASWAFQIFILGFHSLMLTIANILCVIVFGTVILKIKRVAPDKIPQEFPEFWKTDIETHFEHTNNKSEGCLLEEARKVLGLKEAGNDGKSGVRPSDMRLEETFLKDIVGKAKQDTNLINILNRIPLPPPAPLTRNGTVPDFGTVPDVNPRGLHEARQRANSAQEARCTPDMLALRRKSCFQLSPQIPRTPSVSFAPERPSFSFTGKGRDNNAFEAD